MTIPKIGRPLAPGWNPMNRCIEQVPSFQTIASGTVLRWILLTNSPFSHEATKVTCVDINLSLKLYPPVFIHGRVLLKGPPTQIGSTGSVLIPIRPRLFHLADRHTFKLTSECCEYPSVFDKSSIVIPCFLPESLSWNHRSCAAVALGVLVVPGTPWWSLHISGIWPWNAMAITWIWLANKCNVGIAIINHPFLMVHTSHLWWLEGCFNIAIPTLVGLVG